MLIRLNTYNLDAAERAVILEAAPISGQCPSCKPHTCLPMHTPPASCNDGSARPWRGP